MGAMNHHRHTHHLASFFCCWVLQKRLFKSPTHPASVSASEQLPAALQGPPMHSQASSSSSSLEHQVLGGLPHPRGSCCCQAHDYTRCEHAAQSPHGVVGVPLHLQGEAILQSNSGAPRTALHHIEYLALFHSDQQHVSPSVMHSRPKAAPTPTPHPAVCPNPAHPSRRCGRRRPGSAPPAPLLWPRPYSPCTSTSCQRVRGQRSGRRWRWQQGCSWRGWRGPGDRQRRLQVQGWGQLQRTR